MARKNENDDGDMDTENTYNYLTSKIIQILIV